MKKCILWLLCIATQSIFSGTECMKTYSPYDVGVPLITLKSSFPDGGHIPEVCTQYGDNKSPYFEWSGAPLAPLTKSYVLICQDSSAGNFVHMGIFNIPGHKTDFPAAAANAVGDLPEGCKQCKNGFGKNTWGGPKPPQEGPLSAFPHVYEFTIYALDTMLNLESGVSVKQLLEAMRGSVLAKGTLKGIYQKSK